MNSSESGRKVNQTLRSTGIAVGGALGIAKSSFSNFWSTFAAPAATTAPPTPTALQPSGENSCKKPPEDENALGESSADEEDVITVKIENVDDTKEEKQVQSSAVMEQKEPENNANGIVEIGREADRFNANNKIGSVQDV